MLSHVRLFETPCTAVCQAFLYITTTQSLLKLMSIELVMLSNHLILCRPLLLLPSIIPSIRVFSNESALRISIGVSASSSVLPMNIQDWFPLRWTSWISCCPGDSQESSPAPQFESINSVLLLFCFFRIPYFGTPLTEHPPQGLTFISSIAFPAGDLTP